MIRRYGSIVVTVLTALMVFAGCELGAGPAGTDPPDYVPRELDLSVLIDGSGSVTDPQFEDMTDGIASGLRSALNVDDSIRLAVNVFADASNHGGSFALQSYTSATSDGLLDAIRALMKPTGWTRVDLALNDVIAAYDGDAGASSREQVILLLVDGRPFGTSGPIDICPLENDLKSRGIRVIVVGIGDGYSSIYYSCLPSDTDGDMYELTAFADVATLPWSTILD